MSHLFNRYREAQSHARAVNSNPARAALNTIHLFLLEAGGMPLRLLPERYVPIKPLDVLYFFNTVARLFTEWKGEARHYPELPGNREHLLQFQEATALIPTLPTESARNGLATFLSLLLNTPVPEGEVVDALFCARLVANLFSHSEWLEPILSGDTAWETTDPWAGILD